MNKKIIILVTVIIVIIGGAILMKNYLKPYSLTGDKNVLMNTSQTANEINIKNFTFSPATLNATIGTKITWKQNGQAIHKIVSREELFSSNDLKTGDEFSFVFTKAGEYNYYCEIHPSMSGKIIIK